MADAESSSVDRASVPTAVAVPPPDGLARPRDFAAGYGEGLSFGLSLGGGGLFFGGETGLLAGTFRARQKIGSDRDGRDRIQRAFRRFQADALRQQAAALENEGKGSILGL